ncbi:MAG: hypothetical protein J5734_04990 [Prevotella sp.]|nr:hypothetical protein [Prevotella sp.]
MQPKSTQSQVVLAGAGCFHSGCDDAAAIGAADRLSKGLPIIRGNGRFEMPASIGSSDTLY